MEVPKYLQILWNSKWLLLIGILIAAVAAFFAGFTVNNGEIEPRAEQTYQAGTTLLVASQTQPLYQAVIPGQPLVEGQSAPEDVDLTSKAILYAYLISGIEMRTEVEAQTGELAEGEALTALRRTTQPAGDESFAGRYTLPILEVVGTSNDPERAELISRTAAELFHAQVVADQNAAEIPETDRVLISTLDEKGAQEGEGSNPAIPVVVTFLGVFLLFVAAAYIIAGAKASRARKKAAKAAAAASVPAPAPAPEAAATREPEPVDDTLEDDLVRDAPAAPRPRARSRSRAVPVEERDDAPVPETVHSA